MTSKVILEKMLRAETHFRNIELHFLQIMKLQEKEIPFDLIQVKFYLNG